MCQTPSRYTAPGILSCVQYLLIKVIETPHFSAVSLADKYSIVLSFLVQAARNTCVSPQLFFLNYSRNRTKHRIPFSTILYIYSLILDLLDCLYRFYSCCSSPEDMAFKRSAVRYRLSPLKKFHILSDGTYSYFLTNENSVFIFEKQLGYGELSWTNSNMFYNQFLHYPV